MAGDYDEKHPINYWDLLPDDVASHVFNWLTWQERFNLRSVNGQLNQQITKLLTEIEKLLSLDRHDFFTQCLADESLANIAIRHPELQTKLITGDVSLSASTVLFKMAKQFPSAKAYITKHLSHQLTSEHKTWLGILFPFGGCRGGP